MTTTTTHSAGPRRVERGHYSDALYDAFAPPGSRGVDYYTAIGEIDVRSVLTYAAPGRPRLAGSIVILRAGWVAWTATYEPATRVTVGGLAEAHEAVCARVERGELP